jgi:hypothetical protein
MPGHVSCQLLLLPIRSTVCTALTRSSRSHSSQYVAAYVRLCVSLAVCVCEADRPNLMYVCAVYVLYCCNDSCNSGKMRVPAWTDRILFVPHQPAIQVLNYTRYTYATAILCITYRFYSRYSVLATLLYAL